MSVHRWLALLAVPAALLATTTPVLASPSSPATSGTEIILAETAFGPA